MSEKKEKQWAVLKYVKHGVEHITNRLPIKIEWFDSLRDANAYAKLRRSKTKKFDYYVRPMTRGPRA